MWSHFDNPASLPVITGIGVICALGAGREALWHALRTGYSGVRTVIAFNTDCFPTKVACEVEGSTLQGYGDSLPGGGRAGVLGLIAAREALQHSRCSKDEVELLCVGTTTGNLPDFEARLDASAIRTGEDANGPSCTDLGASIASHLGIRGPGRTMLTACSAGNVAIAHAAELVSTGAVGRVLAGGAEAFSRLSFIGFSRMRAMAKTCCRPFDIGRDGMLLGEGAAFLLVESLNSAERRKVAPLAVICGYGLTCDAEHIAVPNGTGAARAMAQALSAAQLSAEAVDFVCAHGTGTLQNDTAEARACCEALNPHRPPIVSIKALTGHALGASSAIEAVACTLSIVNQEIFPQWELANPDPSCDVCLPLPGDPQLGRTINVVLNNAFAFGGNNSCIVLRRPT